jgi:acyl carrier protein
LLATWWNTAWSTRSAPRSPPFPPDDDPPVTSWSRSAAEQLHFADVPAETHVEQGPIGRDEIFEIVRDRLADILEIEPSSISEGQSFVDDLDADSLALIELVEALEEELSDRTVGFRIDDEDLEDLKTVRDAVDYVHERAKSS